MHTMNIGKTEGKKLLSGILSLFLLGLMAVPAMAQELMEQEYQEYGDYQDYQDYQEYASPQVLMTTLYAPDGKTILIPVSEKSVYLELGWYENKEDVMVTMYARDGRIIQVYRSQVAAYQAVGWFTSLDEIKAVTMTTMYAPDGRTIQVYSSQVPEYEAVGWYVNKEDAQTTMYAIDGRTFKVFSPLIAAYQAVDWFLFPDYVNLKVDRMLKSDGYANTVDFIEELMTTADGQKYAALLTRKRSEICSSWQQSVKSPIVILSYTVVTNNSGVPEVSIQYRNLTDQDIISYEFEFACLDAAGKVTTDYPKQYNGTYSGWSEDDILEAFTKEMGTWVLENNKQTVSIRNLHLSRAVTVDGTKLK